MLKTKNMATHTCHFCGNPITDDPVILIKDVTTVPREDIEADVEVVCYFCSEECKEDYI